MEGQSAWGFRRWSAGRETEGGDLAEGRGRSVRGGEGGGGRRGSNGSKLGGGGARKGLEVVEPWIDVSSACPAGRERLRPDILSFSVSLSLILPSRSVCLSPSVFPSLVLLRFACSFGFLIRRERGDNSSPRLSLDESLGPPRAFSSPFILL